MGDQTESKPVTESAKLDLSSLSALSLGPDWVSGKGVKSPSDYEFDEGGGRGRRGGQRDRRGGGGRDGGSFGGTGREGAPSRGGARERGGFGERSGGPGREGGDRRGGGGRPRGEGFGARGGFEERGGRREEDVAFEPIVAVDFYPEEEPFKALSHAIRTSCRTFELFEIARLILEKPERFVCVLKDPLQKEGDPARLYACVVDGLPFRSEDEALKHVFRHYLGEFFEIESVEGEAPSGTFTLVHKCGMTGELLSPPNYHRYRALCREHHADKLSHVPYERFEQRIETSREEADLQAWLEKMKKKTRYTLKTDTSKVFETLEDARLHLLTHAKEQLVRPAWSARFGGKAIALLNPGDPIRRSVEFLLEGQKRFPLDTANHLRGRLRRMNFAVYKRGSKGISFVCAVKRRFRKPSDVLADNLQELIDFLDAHPNYPAKDLPKGYLGINLEPEPKKAEAEAAVPDATAETAVDEVADPETAAEAPKPKVVVQSPEITMALRQLKNDLHYLVSEGYVTEFSDGRLLVPPVMEDEAPKAPKVSKNQGTKAPAAAVAATAKAATAKGEAPQPVESVETVVPVVPEPEPEAAVTEPEAAEPEVAEPEPEAAETEPEAAVTAPEVSLTEPEATDVAPEPVVPEPVVSEPEVAKPEPEAAVTEPVAAEPEATVAEPAVTEPAPEVAEPEAAEPEPEAKEAAPEAAPKKD